MNVCNRNFQCSFAYFCESKFIESKPKIKIELFQLIIIDVKNSKYYFIESEPNLSKSMKMVLNQQKSNKAKTKIVQ